MLRRDAGKSVSFQRGFRGRGSLCSGGAFLAFLALMLLAAPQSAFAQETVDVTLSAFSLSVTEGSSNTYTVKLDREPSAEVILTIVENSDAISISGGSEGKLTFTTEDFSTPQTVTVSAGEDDNAVDEKVRITHTATVGGKAATVNKDQTTVSVTVDDNDARGVTVSQTETLTVAEAGTANYTVVLTSEPTDTVTIDVGGASGEITVSPSRLTFTPGATSGTTGHWQQTQTVNVYAGEDFDSVNDTATLTHTVRGGDYTGESANSVAVTVDDNDDTQTITVTPTTLRIATGLSGSYTVALGSQPEGTVKITVTEASDNLTVSPTSLTFSKSNWKSPRTVRVSAKSGLTSDDTGLTVTQSLDTSSSGRDTAWDAVGVSNVSVDIIATKTTVSLSTSSLTVSEGATATYKVKLKSEPNAATDVTITGGGDGTDITLSTSTLAFTTDNWNTQQEVTVTGKADADAVQETFAVTHRVGSEADATLRVTVREKNTRRVTLSETSLAVPEGGSGEYNVVLDSQPTGNVTVTVGGASGDVTVTPAQLTFATDTWSTAKTVTVKAAADEDGQTDPAVTLTHKVRGADYDGLSAGTVRVTITETGKPGITVTPATLTLTEGGAAGSYTVKLDSQPTETVTVTVQGLSGDVTVDPSRLLFTSATWDTPQKVTVKAGEDADAETDPAVTLTHAASGGDYGGVTGGKVTVTITENDTRGVTVTPTVLPMIEGAAPRTYTVVLWTQPTGPVTVTVGGLTSAHAGSLSVSPTVLRFDSSNWYIPKVVTVTALEDDDGADVASFNLTHTVSGGGYVHRLTSEGITDGDASNITVSPVTVTVDDNDTIGLTVTPTAMEIVAGKRKTYSVVLNTKPTADVAVTTSGGSITASPTTLTFTQNNWNKARTVFVDVPGGTSTGEQTVSNTPANGGYGTDQAVNVTVNVKSTDAPGIAVSPTKLSITEGENASYTVVLSKEPTATVTIDISGASGNVRLSRSRLTFSASNYDREQTVTVSLAKDDDAEPEPAATIVHKVSGASEYTTGDSPPTASSVSVTFKETDTRSVIVTPTSLTVAAGLSGTYKIRLNSQPVSDVTVSVTSDDSGVTVDPSSLTFTSTNWKTAQTATVNVAKSAGGETVKTVTLSHSVAGGHYQDQNPPDVIVTIPLEGAPGAPSGLTATGGDKQVELAWGPPSNDGGSPVLRYEYRVMQAGAGFSQWTRISGGAGARSHTVTDLANGTSYTFEVRAVNAVGEGPSAAATVELADSVPAAPAGFSAAGGDGSVRLSWSAAADGGSQIIRYEYRYRASGGDWGEWTALSATATSVTISDLTNGTEYEFQVRAVNGIGNGPASSTGAPAGTAPSAPVGLSARVGDGMIMVSWGMPSNNGGFPVLRYQLRYRESGATSWTTITVDGGANATSATLTDLTNGQSYEIEVWAVNRIGGGATAGIGAVPMEGMDFAHFANGVSGDVTMTSDIVLVNVETSTVNPAIYFYDQQGGMLDAATVVDATGELAVNGDGVLTVPLGLRGRGEITISTNGQGPLVVGSVKVFAGGRIGGVLRFDIPNLGVAGVGTSEPVTDAIFPARRVAGGINTGAAIRNLSGGPLTVTCDLMKDGRVLDTELVNLAVDGQSARFIDEMFSGADTSDFTGSVRCLAAEGGTFTGLALEMDFSGGQIFTTLPVVPVDAEAADDGESTLNFAHFANGDGGSPITSDLVFVNVANTAVGPAVYFYDQQGGMINAATLVDAMGGVEVSDSGALTVTDEIPPMGEMTISTNGMGEIVVGSVKVVSDGPIGGVLRFDVPSIGVAGVGASHGFREAIFPARRVDGGINTGAAIRNLGSEATTVTCRLMKDGQRLDETVISLAGNGQSSRFINEMFTGADTSDFEGSVHCAAPAGSSFTGVALEMDFNNRAFTTLPVIRVR